MSISTRKAGAIVTCPTCGDETLVPMTDQFSTPVSADSGNQPDHFADRSPDETEDRNAGTNTGHSEAEAFQSTSNLNFNPTSSLIESEKAEGEEASVEPEDDQPAMTLRKRRFAEEEMDLTPMVDVTFQLLIFFMVTASFALQKSIQVPTPDPDQKGAAQQMQTFNDIQGTSIIVKIDAANAIIVDDEPLNDPKQLNDVLSTKMRREQKTELLLTAHSLALHRTVIGVIDAANDVGMQKIRMTSRKASD